MNTKSIVLSLVLALGTGAAFAAPAGEAFDYPGQPATKATATVDGGAGPVIAAGEAFDYPAEPATKVARDARTDPHRAAAPQADRFAGRASGPYYMN